MLAAYLAREVGPQGIRVNTLLPGWMWGEPVQANVRRAAAEAGLSEEQMVEKIAASIALRRIVTDDMARRDAADLDLASAMTGALVDANGGEFLP